MCLRFWFEFEFDVFELIINSAQRVMSCAEYQKDLASAKLGIKWILPADSKLLIS